MSTSYINPDSASRLPFDIVLRIISHIDSSTAEGRRTLAACARFSRACRVAAENALYRHAVFDPPRLTTFLVNVLGRGNNHGGGVDHSAHVRAKRLIGVIEHLRFGMEGKLQVCPSLSCGRRLLYRLRFHYFPAFEVWLYCHWNASSTVRHPHCDHTRAACPQEYWFSMRSRSAPPRHQYMDYCLIFQRAV